MKAYELIELIKGPIQIIIRNGINIQDVAHLDLYKNILDMTYQLGSRKEAILVTATKYGLTKQTIQCIIKKMEKVVVLTNKYNQLKQ